MKKTPCDVVNTAERDLGIMVIGTIHVADALDWVQPECQEEWKMYRKKNE
jgi:hypothetical protein